MKGLRAFLLSITFCPRAAAHVREYFAAYDTDVYGCLMRAQPAQLEYVRRYLYRDKPRWEYALDRLLFERDLRLATREPAAVAAWARQHRFFKLADAVCPPVLWHDRQQGALFEGVIAAQEGKVTVVLFANKHRERAAERDLVRALPPAKGRFRIGERVVVRRRLAGDGGVVSWWKGRVADACGGLSWVKWTCTLDEGEEPYAWIKNDRIRSF